MNNLWRKSFMAGILSVSLTAGAVTPAFASAAPDGKTDAASLAGSSPLSQVMLSVTAVNLSLQEQKPILQQVKQWKQHRLKRQNQMQQQK